MTQEALGEAIGKSRSHIANTMRLLNLPPTVQMEGVCPQVRLRKKSFALRSVLRKNSKAVPWNEFVPDFVITLTFAPGLRP